MPMGMFTMMPMVLVRGVILVIGMFLVKYMVLVRGTVSVSWTSLPLVGRLFPIFGSSLHIS